MKKIREFIKIYIYYQIFIESFAKIIDLIYYLLKKSYICLSIKIIKNNKIIRTKIR